tara:strand:- start:719 stop:1804 length:1086 start_codon:yes stop_codon:yes gene_type:complete
MSNPNEYLADIFGKALDRASEKEKGIADSLQAIQKQMNAEIGVEMTLGSIATAVLYRLGNRFEDAIAKGMTEESLANSYMLIFAVLEALQGVRKTITSLSRRRGFEDSQEFKWVNSLQRQLGKLNIHNALTNFMERTPLESTFEPRSRFWLHRGTNTHMMYLLETDEVIKVQDLCFHVSKIVLGETLRNHLFEGCKNIVKASFAEEDEELNSLSRGRFCAYVTLISGKACAHLFPLPVPVTSDLGNKFFQEVDRDYEINKLFWNDQFRNTALNRIQTLRNGLTTPVGDSTLVAGTSLCIFFNLLVSYERLIVYPNFVDYIKAGGYWTEVSREIDKKIENAFKEGGAVVADATCYTCGLDVL